MAKLNELSVNERLCVLFYFFPTNAHNADMQKLGGFFYERKTDLGAGINFEWDSPSAVSKEINEAYDALHLVGLLSYQTPKLRFKVDSLLSNCSRDLISRLEDEEREKAQRLSKELSKLLSN